MFTAREMASQLKLCLKEGLRQHGIEVVAPDPLCSCELPFPVLSVGILEPCAVDLVKAGSLGL